VAVLVSPRQRRLALAALALSLVLSCVGGTARASLAASSSCSYGATEHPFLRWLDPAAYTLVPGGSFEGGATGWTLAGGAKVVAGNETFLAHSSSDRSSLALPSGASATTARFCVSLVRPTIRLFVSNTGSSSSRLGVKVVFRGPLGILGALDGGTVTAGKAWQPSPVMLATLNAPLGTDSAQFVFSTKADGGSWRIDDVYVDPWVNRS
jgi:hypothetical protein